MNIVDKYTNIKIMTQITVIEIETRFLNCSRNSDGIIRPDNNPMNKEIIGRYVIP
jgi:hypothetical protein